MPLISGSLYKTVTVIGLFTLLLCGSEANAQMFLIHSPADLASAKSLSIRPFWIAATLRERDSLRQFQSDFVHIVASGIREKFPFLKVVEITNNEYPSTDLVLEGVYRNIERSSDEPNLFLGILGLLEWRRTWRVEMVVDVTVKRAYDGWPVASFLLSPMGIQGLFTTKQGAIQKALRALSTEITTCLIGVFYRIYIYKGEHEKYTSAPPVLRAVHNGPVNTVAFSPDSRRLATGSSDGAIRLWDIATGQAGVTLSGHVGAVSAVLFDSDGKQIISGGADGTLRRWEVGSGRCISSILAGHGKISAVALSTDGEIIASAGKDNVVRLWEKGLGNESRRLKGHGGSILSIAFSRIGKRLATSSADKTVRVWDVENGRELLKIKVARRPALCVRLSPGGVFLAYGTADGRVHIREIAGSRDNRISPGHYGPVTSLAFSPDGRYLAIAGRDASVVLWDAARNLESRIVAFHVPLPLSVAISPDGRYLASSGADNMATVLPLTVPDLQDHK